MPLPQHLKNHFAQALNLELKEVTALSGGSVGQSYRLKDLKGKSYFLKYLPIDSESRFLSEAHGLQELSQAQDLKVPHVIDVGPEHLLLEFIEQGPSDPDFFRRFGRALAKMHRIQGEVFGFYEDNYCGLSRQVNTPTVSVKSAQDEQKWAEFYFEKRLLYQYQIAQEKGNHCSELGKLLAQLEKKMERLLEGSFEPPSLLHGDLWSGNFLPAANGQAYLIDPATYYGHREADLAMTTLFGGFPSVFYQAYEEVWPFKHGFYERQGLYQLYHVLNHYNLFGGHYYQQALNLLQRYL